jgi:DNA-binding NtrC family response regulator
MSEQARILVVDDERDMCLIVQHILERQGYQVECAYNGATALAKVQEHRFDLVLSDIRMPDIDGIELLQRIKEINRDTAVILITALASLDTAMHAAKYQADDYLTKPFASGRDLVEIVARHLAGPAKDM